MAYSNTQKEVIREVFRSFNEELGVKYNPSFIYSPKILPSSFEFFTEKTHLPHIYHVLQKGQ